jgi:2-oxo-4-hydroxy-4-carboxy--5-ureidoimidazoline (OHCU) decarboxylase
MHDLPRFLTADELAALFEGRTRFVERLATHEYPLVVAPWLLRMLPEDEIVEALGTHPRIGEAAGSAASRREQRAQDDPEVLDELRRLNQAYEAKFGFRFVVFVHRRPRSEILAVLRERLERPRAEELQRAIDDLAAIAADRYRSRG